MSESETNEPAQTPSSGQPPSSEPRPGAETEPSGSDEPSRGLRGAGLRYSEDDDVPDWAKGKTADEILQTAEQLYQTVLSGANAPTQPSQPAAGAAGVGSGSQAPTSPTQPTPNPNPQPQPQPGAQPVQTQNGMVQPPDPDLMYEDKAEYNRQLQAWHQAQTQQAVQQASGPILQPLAQMARQQSQSGSDYAEVWKRYGPEIDAVMQSVPVQQRTNSALWDQAAQMVAGRHVNELARAEAERIAAEPADAGTVSGAGDGPPNPTPSGSGGPIAKLFKEGHPSVERFKEEGMTPERVAQHAASMGHSEEDYAEMLRQKSTMRTYERGVAGSGAGATV